MDLKKFKEEEERVFSIYASNLYLEKHSICQRYLEKSTFSVWKHFDYFF